MSTDHKGRAPLPGRPSLGHLKNQANDLLKAGMAKSITAAQFQIARLYGFVSWPKLKTYVESLGEIGELNQAIDRDDLDSVKTLMSRNPALHRAPMGYANDGPLTCAAECRVPCSAARLDMVRWMIEHGSDVHQGGDAPLMRAALQKRIPMMELLVAHGANVNGAIRDRCTPPASSQRQLLPNCLPDENRFAFV